MRTSRILPISNVALRVTLAAAAVGCGLGSVRQVESARRTCDQTLNLATPSNVNISHSVEFTTILNPQLSERPFSQPLVSVDNKTFFVWVDYPSNRPYVTQKINGIEKVAPIDPKSDYAVFYDSHHTFSIGIDKKGYIHVMGDMHGYPMYVERSPAFPNRYKDQANMYWVSNKPYDVSGGFSFAGGAGASTSIPAMGMTFARFHQARNGDLFVTSIVDAYLYGEAPASPYGNRALGLYKYDADNRTWSAIGDYPNVKVNPDPAYGRKFKVFFWELAGMSPNNWFQAYIPGLEWDLQNNIHISWAATVNNAYDTNTRLFYAMSPDGGVTWKRANGKSLGALPFRGADSSPIGSNLNVPDVVIDTQGRGGLDDYTNLAIDSAGNPVIYNTGSWYRWNGQKWLTDTPIPKADDGYTAVQGNDGVMNFINSETFKIFRMASAGDKTASEIDLGAYFRSVGLRLNGWRSVSKPGFQSSGDLYGVAVDEASGKQSVVKINLPGITGIPWSKPNAETPVSNGTPNTPGTPEMSTATGENPSSMTGSATNTGDTDDTNTSNTSNPSADTGGNRPQVARPNETCPRR